MLHYSRGSKSLRQLLSSPSVRRSLVQVLGRFCSGFPYDDSRFPNDDINYPGDDCSFTDDDSSLDSSSITGLPNDLASFSTLFRNACGGHLTPSEHKVLNVQQNYGLLNLRGDVHFVVKPDLESMCGSMCSVRLLVPSGTSPSLSLHQSNDKSQLTVEARCCDAPHQDVLPHCEVTLPIKYDLHADLSGKGSIEIFELQNESTTIRTEHGRNIVHKLQSLNLTYDTHSGPLSIYNKILASVDARGEHLVILGNGIQAGRLRLKCKELSCSLHSVHANSVEMLANTANIAIKDITADSHLSLQTANIDIGNCSGSMTWQMGEASLRLGVPQLLQDSSISINAGRCSVACPAEYRYGFSMAAESINVRPGFKNLSYGTEEQQWRRKLQTVKGGDASPKLSTLLKKGSLTLVPWSWPHTKH